MTSLPRPQIGLLVLDLDDTVWTWFDAWHASFVAMLDGTAAQTGIKREVLIPAIKKLHEEKGTAEYSWLLDELPILEPARNGQKANVIFGQVLHSQNSARKTNTHLYPGVFVYPSVCQEQRRQDRRIHRVARILDGVEDASYGTGWNYRCTVLVPGSRLP
jgi:hypothetical protein